MSISKLCIIPCTFRFSLLALKFTGDIEKILLYTLSRDHHTAFILTQTKQNTSVDILVTPSGRSEPLSSPWHSHPPSCLPVHLVSRRRGLWMTCQARQMQSIALGLAPSCKRVCVRVCARLTERRNKCQFCCVFGFWSFWYFGTIYQCHRCAHRKFPFSGPYLTEVPFYYSYYSSRNSCSHCSSNKNSSNCGTVAALVVEEVRRTRWTPLCGKHATCSFSAKSPWSARSVRSLGLPWRWMAANHHSSPSCVYFANEDSWLTSSPPFSTPVVHTNMLV